MLERMNQLPIETRARILSCLVEGVSIRGTARLCGVCISSVVKIQIEAGQACAEFQDRTFRNLSCRRLECDEIWSFVGAKEKNASEEKKVKGWGDVWTWTAIDADSKLIPCWHVGTRDAGAAYEFMQDLASRLAHRVQLTTDGYRPYLQAVEEAFGSEIDYATLTKIYGEGPKTEARYSPAHCCGTRLTVRSGRPDAAKISTSYVERQNLNIRMGMRRFTRLTNAFSKKLENHGHALALYFMHYNFCRIHTTLRVTPAMQAGVADRVWEMADVVRMLDSFLIEQTAA
jgi:IS1 family transposase